MASAGCAGTADVQAVSRRAAVRMSGSVRFMCGSLLLGWCRDEWDYYPVGAGHARPGGWRGQASMVRPVGRGLDPSAGDCPGDGRWRKVSRGVGDAAPYGLPGNGRRREPAPHPALRGHLPPRGKARVVIPPGVLAAAEGRGGVGAPRPTDGNMETLWGLRGQPFPGRRAVGAGHCGVVSVGPRLSGAKPGSEQCLPPRGKQPHERASFAGWRRSLCAAKRPARGVA